MRALVSGGTGSDGRSLIDASFETDVLYQWGGKEYVERSIRKNACLIGGVSVSLSAHREGTLSLSVRHLQPA